MPVFALWSAPRARSTAFFRSMLERGDLLVVHEPFSDLIGLGETDVDGRPFTSVDALVEWLLDETDDISVFVKDTPNARHADLFSDARILTELHHTFLIRRPEEIAASFRAVEPAMTIESIGLVQLRAFHDAVASVAAPVVIDADDLVDDPHAVMAAYCDAAGLPFVPAALTWSPGDRPEWRRSARWHRDVSTTVGFGRVDRAHEPLDEELARWAAHHRPAYDALHARRLRG